MTHRFQDTMVLDENLRITGSGYGVLSARVARADNVQIYAGSELGFDNMETVRVFRPESEVFKKDALSSYSGVPVTIGHPKDQVTANNWKDFAVGEIGEDILRDGAFIRVPMMLRDAQAINTVKSGVRELSMGYDATVILQTGESPTGEAYDAVMSDFQMNHVAIVPRARGGSELRIGDEADKWGASPVTLKDKEGNDMPDNLKTVVVGDEAVTTTDEGARAIEKLKAQLVARDTSAATAKTDHDAAIAAKDEEIGKLKGELKVAQDALPKDGDLDKLVADRATLVSSARAVLPTLDATGKSDAEIRKAVVIAKFGDEAVKDASVDMIRGMFQAITKNSDSVRDAIQDGIPPKIGDTVAAHQAYVDRLTSAWKAPQKGAN